MNAMATVTCPACGEAAASPKARFCENCGRPLDAGAQASPPSPGGKGCRCVVPEPDGEGFCEACGLRVVPQAPAPEPVPDYEESLDAGLALACDRGRKHPENEDYGCVARRADGTSLLVVCDGVSSAVNAAGASHAAVDAARAAFLAGPAALPGLGIEEQVRACASAAAGAVAALDAGGDPEGGPATTAVLAVVRERTACVAWAGDSRAYLVMPGVPEDQVTRDDSWCRMVVDAGRMSYEAALQDPKAHAITQWLGMPEAELDIHVRTVSIPPRTGLVLCSDGLWNYVDGSGRLGRAYAEAFAGGDAREACRKLVALANAAGGRDNITVAIHVPA
jgi:serine/threonine protein phosphatase PrpC